MMMMLDESLFLIFISVVAVAGAKVDTMGTPASLHKFDN